MPRTNRQNYAAQALAALEKQLPKDDWVRVKDVADALGKKADTIRAHIECGDFFAGNHGPEGQQRIWRQSVIDWMRSDLGITG